MEPLTNRIEAAKLLLHENQRQSMAEQMVLGMWPTISHVLSPKQRSMIRVMHIPYSLIAHVGTKRKPLTKAGSSNILVHMVATYDAIQDVLGFLCRRVL